MPTSAAILRRRRLARKGIGTVYLHGYPRATTDLDLYTDDRRVTASELVRAPFKQMVDAMRAGESARGDQPRF